MKPITVTTLIIFSLAIFSLAGCAPMEYSSDPSTRIIKITEYEGCELLRYDPAPTTPHVYLLKCPSSVSTSPVSGII